MELDRIDLADMGRSMLRPYTETGADRSADGHGGGFAFDLGDVLGGEFYVAGLHYAIGLFVAAGTYDRAIYGGGEQRPGDGDFAGSAAVAVADGAQAIDEFEILREFRLAEFRFAAAPIV